MTDINIQLWYHSKEVQYIHVNVYVCKTICIICQMRNGFYNMLIDLSILVIYLNELKNRNSEYFYHL